MWRLKTPWTDEWATVSVVAKNWTWLELTHTHYDMSGLVDTEMNQTNIVYFTAQRSQEDCWEKVTIAVSWRVNRNCYKRGHILPEGLSVPSRSAGSVWDVWGMRGNCLLHVQRLKGCLVKGCLKGQGMYQGLQQESVLKVGALRAL